MCCFMNEQFQLPVLGSGDFQETQPRGGLPHTADPSPFPLTHPVKPGGAGFPQPLTATAGPGKTREGPSSGRKAPLPPDPAPDWRDTGAFAVWKL